MIDFYPEMRYNKYIKREEDDYMIIDTQMIMGIISELDADFDNNDVVDLARENGWRYARGATKSCFILPHADYVIKFCKPSRKRSNSREMDECELEACAYKSAKEYRVEKVLLETRFIGENEYGVKFFAQPKIETTQCDIPFKLDSEFRRKTNKISSKLVYKVTNSMYCSTSDLWIKMLILLYGKKFARSFEEWTKANRVNDLHEANIGYYKNKPVLLDYSGFRTW